MVMCKVHVAPLFPIPSCDRLGEGEVTSLCQSLLFPCPIVEEVAGFDVPVDDVVGVDVPQRQEQCPHVITSLRERHVGEVVLGIQM